MVLGNAASSKGVDEQTKDILAAVAKSAESLSESDSYAETDKLEKMSDEIENKDKPEDLSVPKWPKYSDPSTQKDEIAKELIEVKKQHAHWSQLYTTSLKQSKDKSRFLSLTEFKKKQNEIDLQHNLTVQKIKQEIYSDREEFLSQLIKLQEETKSTLIQQQSVKDEKKKEEKKKEVPKRVLKKSEANDDELDEKSMMKDIMGDGEDIISEKEIHASDIDDLSEGKSKKKVKKTKKVDHEKIREDEDGKYIDDYKEVYHRTKGDIIDTLDGHAITKKSYKKKVFESTEDDEFMSRHLSEEEWTLKEKKEKENLQELISKEHELEAAAKDVKEAQDSLSGEKKKIDDEINMKIKETENMRKDFEKKASERAEAERRAAEIREKIELEERQSDKKKRTEQLKETQEIEQKAYELHEKENELKK